MSKKGEDNKSLYTIFILIAVVVILYILYKILETKIAGGIFKGI